MKTQEILKILQKNLNPLTNDFRYFGCFIYKNKYKKYYIIIEFNAQMPALLRPLDTQNCATPRIPMPKM